MSYREPDLMRRTGGIQVSRIFLDPAVTPRDDKQFNTPLKLQALSEAVTIKVL
jgi:hypothetical protein